MNRCAFLFLGSLASALLTLSAAAQTSPQPDNAGNDNPTGVTGEYNGNITTGCSYDASTGNAKRVVYDIVVPGSVGAYPLKWSRTYNTRESTTGRPGGMGLGWLHSYSWLLNPVWGDIASFPDGRVIGNDDGSSGVADYVDNGVIYLSDGGRVTFEVLQNRYPDGAPYDEYRVYQVIDPYGQAQTMEYNDYARDRYGNQLYQLLRVWEPGGRYLQIGYDPATGNVARVEAHDPQGNLTQWVNYTYVNEGKHRVYPALSRVAYNDGTFATYTWQDDNHPNTYNSAPNIPVLKTADDVRYHGPMRQIEYELARDGRIRGKIKAERKIGTSEAVSTLTFPSLPNNPMRTETRGDGQTRTFRIPGMLRWYTDFQGRRTDLARDVGGFINRVSDAKGHVTLYNRNGGGDLIQLVHQGDATHADGSHIDYTYWNNSHLMASKTDERQGTDADSHTTYYDRTDGTGRINQIRYPDTAYETFGYNGFGQVTTHRRKNGNYEHFEYDGNGRLLKRWNPTANSSPSYADPYTSFEYYPGGHPWADRVWKRDRPARKLDDV